MQHNKSMCYANIALHIHGASSYIVNMNNASCSPGLTGRPFRVMLLNIVSRTAQTPYRGAAVRIWSQTDIMAKKPNTTESASVPTEIAVHGHVVNVTDIPEASRFALMKRGFVHILGNEVASKVTAWKKTDAGTNATEAEIDAKTEAFRAEALAKIMDGTMSVRVGTTRGTALETVMREVAIERLKSNFAAAIKKNPAHPKFPADAKTTINVRGEELTRAVLIERHIAKFRDVIESEARRRMAETDTDEAADVSDLI